MKILRRLPLIFVVFSFVFLPERANAFLSPGSGAASLPMVIPALEGGSNTFYGASAGQLTAGDTQRDSFFGRDAGYSTTGIDNTFAGYYAGITNGSSANNTFTGSNAGRYSNAADNTFTG